MNRSSYQKESTPTNPDISNTHTRNFIMLASFALLLDMFVILLMLWNKKLRKRRSNKLLLNLLISDGIVCVSFITYCANVMIASNDASSFYDLYLQQLKLFVLIDVVVLLSLFNLTLITLDRLIAVKWPFFYEERIQTKQILIAIGIIWAITIVHGIVLMILYHVLDRYTIFYLGNVVFLVVIITGFVVLLASNFFVFVEARRQLRAIEKISIEHLNKSQKRANKFRKKECRLVRINIGLVLCFFLFWINTLIITVKLLIYSDETCPPITARYMLVSWYLVYIYYISNPLWYVGLSQDVKQEVILFFKGNHMEEATNSSSLSL